MRTLAYQRKLRYFAEVARTGHLGRAAGILSVSASAVSHAIADLEEELGVELFVRKGRRIMLTPDGVFLSEQAAGILGKVKHARDVLSASHREFPETARIASTHGEVLRRTAACLARSCASQKQMTFELMSMRSADVLKSTVAYEIDFGICLSPQPHPQVETVRLAQWKLGACLSVHHPALKAKHAGGAAVLKELINHPHIVPKAFQGIDNCERHPGLIERDINPPIKGIHDSYDTMVECVAASEAWSLAPAFVLGSRSDVVWVDLGWGHFVEVTGVWLRSRPPSPMIAKLVSDLKVEFTGFSERKAKKHKSK